MPNNPSTRRSHPVALLLAIAILAALAGIAYWLVFGPGVRACTTPFLSSYIRDYLSADMECRAIFGLGALITTGVLLMALAEASCDWGGLLTVGRWLNKGGMAMLAVGLVPLIALLLLLMIIGMLAQSVREKLAGMRSRRGAD